MATARYYIGVADHTYVQAACSQAVCLFSGGKKLLVTNLQQGDHVIYFAPKSSHNGETLNQFVAVGIISDDEAWQKHWPEWKFTSWVRDCEYLTTSPIDKTIDIPNWDQIFKDGRLEVSPEVFTKLATAMGATCSN